LINGKLGVSEEIAQALKEVELKRNK